ncbi:hypothetical protein Q1695_003908 [Nippostrongylus brasiliensis]|nr:hypothetical protein Q1695_003908 [Nippostrongylus brasiliensis]
MGYNIASRTTIKFRSDSSAKRRRTGGRSRRSSKSDRSGGSSRSERRGAEKSRRRSRRKRRRHSSRSHHSHRCSLDARGCPRRVSVRRLNRAAKMDRIRREDACVEQMVDANQLTE